MNKGQLYIEINQLEAKHKLAKTEKEKDNILQDIAFYKRQIEEY